MIILASQSPARGAMLDAAGVAYQALPAHVDEADIMAGLLAIAAPPEHIADTLAGLKAVKISRRHPGMMVLGADTVVVTNGGAVLDKPETRARAEQHLRTLSGTTHKLISAAVIARDGEAIWRNHATVKLTMRHLSSEFIAGYLDAEGEAVLGCVGCYRIEGLGAQLFNKVEGDQFTVRGLPLLAILDFLRLHKILPS